MKSLGVTLQGKPFEHLVYHFVLPYSNWETGMICFSECFESLSEGFQNALWELGVVPLAHRTDQLSTAVQKVDHPEEFTQRYQGLMNHYGTEGRKIQVRKPHENGDVEQSHHRFKDSLDQALMLRGSRDFESREAYGKFMLKMFAQLNAGRRDRLREELAQMRSLPARRLEAYKRMELRVSSGSTIRIQHNVYSVHSRLIREKVQVRLYAEYVEVWYAQRCVEKMPRVRGEGKHRVDYRHIIGWLVRKPGAFENYRFRDALFPTTRFRVAYDALKGGPRGTKDYLRILKLAADEGEAKVEGALRTLQDGGEQVTWEALERKVRSGQVPESVTDVSIPAVDLKIYDAVLESKNEKGAA